MIAEYEDTRELRLLGAYKPGGNRDLDLAVEFVPRLYQYLTQAPDTPVVTDPFREIASLFGPKPSAQPS
jgi:flagellum-specific ATP synthase